MKYILGGHWTIAPEGWIVLRQDDQDITAPLKWKDNEVDALFLEHISEHITLTDNILFFREALRVLKPGGILRIVCPMTDKLASFIQSTLFSKDYTKTSLIPYFSSEDTALREIGLDMANYGQPFLFHSLIKFHQHQFVWSSELMSDVLKKVGFREVNICEPTQSFMDQSILLERKVRGLSQAFVTENEVKFYDCESLAIEARK